MRVLRGVVYMDQGQSLGGHRRRKCARRTGWFHILHESSEMTDMICKRYKIDTLFLLKSNRKSYALYRMLTLPLTLSAP